MTFDQYPERVRMAYLAYLEAANAYRSVSKGCASDKRRCDRNLDFKAAQQDFYAACDEYEISHDRVVNDYRRWKERGV